MIFAVSIREPENALRRASKRAYGNSFVLLKPTEDWAAYESAYKVVSANLDKGESMTVLDPVRGRVTFHTPNRDEKAWSAVVLVIDIARFLVN